MSIYRTPPRASDALDDGDREVYGVRCRDLVAMLQAAARGVHDPRLDGALGRMRREWIAIARTRFPRLDADVEDAVQIAFEKLLSPDKLGSLADVGVVDRWARSVFVNCALDVLRDGKRRDERRLAESADGGDDDVLDRLPASAADPEELLRRHERLTLIRAGLQSLEAAWLRYAEDLPEQEIVERLDSTRDAIATRLKRFRRTLRATLENEP